MKYGYIKYNGIKITEDEKYAANFLVSRGYCIEVVRPQNIPHSKNADFLIGGVIWEVKTPQGESKYGVERIYRKAAKQSNSLIFDLRKSKRLDVKNDILKFYKAYRSIRRLMIITKTEKILVFRKK